MNPLEDNGTFCTRPLFIFVLNQFFLVDMPYIIFSEQNFYVYHTYSRLSVTI